MILSYTVYLYPWQRYVVDILSQCRKLQEFVWEASAELWPDCRFWIWRPSGFGTLPSLVLDEVVLSQTDPVCNMGFFQIHNSYFAQLRVVYHLCPFLECEALLTVTHTLTFRIDYCNMLYGGLPLKSIQQLQLVQLNFVP